MSRPRPQAPPTNQPRLLDQVRTTIRLRGKSYQTEKAYTDWIALHSLPQQTPSEEDGPERTQSITGASFGSDVRRAICHLVEWPSGCDFVHFL